MRQSTSPCSLFLLFLTPSRHLSDSHCECQRQRRERNRSLQSSRGIRDRWCCHRRWRVIEFSLRVRSLGGSAWTGGLRYRLHREAPSQPRQFGSKQEERLAGTCPHSPQLLQEHSAVATDKCTQSVTLSVHTHTLNIHIKHLRYMLVRFLVMRKRRTHKKT